MRQDGRRLHDSRLRRFVRSGLFVLAITVAVPAAAQASEMAALAVEIGRTAVVMHHHKVNPRTIEPTRVIINHQGDICHFQVVMVWSSGTFGGQIGSTPRRAVVYGSLVNRSDIRRLFDLEYIEAPDKPWIGCDNAPKVITYWNTKFVREGTLSPDRELGQPLHRSMHPLPDCETCPPSAEVHVSRDSSNEIVFEGDALAQLIGTSRDVQLVSGGDHIECDSSWFRCPRIRTGRKSSVITAVAIPADTSLSAHR
jgi:hypothetical protein